MNLPVVQLSGVQFFLQATPGAFRMLLPSRLNVDISTEVLEILQSSAHRLLYRTDAPMKAMVVSVVWRFLKDVRVRLRNPQVTSLSLWIIFHISYLKSVGAAVFWGSTASIIGRPRQVALRSGWLDPRKLPSTVLCQKDLDEMARRLAMACVEIKAENWRSVSLIYHVFYRYLCRLFNSISHYITNNLCRIPHFLFLIPEVFPSFSDSFETIAEKAVLEERTWTGAHPWIATPGPLRTIGVPTLQRHGACGALLGLH